jgi:uncharacterized protein with FMN-binding domain
VVTAVKRIVLWLMSTLTVLVLLFGYHTSTSSSARGGLSSLAAPATGGAISGSVGSGSSASSGTSGGSSSSVPSSSAAAAPTTAAPSRAATSKTVTGSVADTRWGPVQVQLTIAAKKITDVSVVQYPNGNGRDQEINSQALPILIQETLDKQSASIDMVSGATVTSDGYLQSLQSALDQAGL